MPRNNVVRLTDYPDMTIAVYHGRKATKHQHEEALVITTCVLCFAGGKPRETGCQSCG